MGFVESFLGKKKSANPIALDIGAHSIKVVEMKEKGGRAHLVKLGIAQTPPGSIKDGFVTDTKSVGDTIRKLLDANQIKEKFCVTALSGQQVVIRMVKLPPMAEDEVKQAISYQADRYIPFPLDQVVLDVHLLGEVTEGESKKVNCLVVAGQKEAINSILETLSEAKLLCQGMDIDPFVSLRSCLESGLSSDIETFSQNLLLIDIGASSCDISVVSNGILRFTRIIPIAGTQFTRAISTTLNINFDEAEKIKKEQGAAILDEEGGKNLSLTVTRQITNILSPILSSLLMEIQRSLAYYESRFRRSRIDKIILSGGTSKLRYLDKYLNRELGVEVVKISPLVNVENNGFSEEYLRAVSPLLNIGVGLGLRELGGISSNKEVTLDNNFEFGSSRQTTGFGPSI